MEVFRRRFSSMVKSLVIAVVTPLVVGFLGTVFLPWDGIVFAASALIFLALLYMAVFSENIRFELENGELRYYQKGRLKQTWQLARCASRYRIQTESGFPPTHDITLYLMELDGGSEEDIDCSPLGYNQFMRLYDLIEQYSPDPVGKLETKKQ